MGFLIFAFRKLCLKRTISQKDFRVMQLSSDLQSLHNQMSIMQQAKSVMQDAWSTTSGCISTTSQNLFQASVNTAQSEASAAANKYEKVFNDSQKGLASASQVEAAKAEMENSKANADNQAKKLFALQQAGQTTNMVANHVVNSVFEQADKAQMTLAHLKENRIEQEKTSLESQLKVLNEELTGVEKAESDSAKKVAPTFGLS